MCRSFVLCALLLVGCDHSSRGLNVDPSQIQPATDTIAVAPESPVASDQVNAVESHQDSPTVPSASDQPTTDLGRTAAGSSGDSALPQIARCAANDQGSGCFPASVAGRKILDQHGDVYLMRSFSSWSMASHLSNEQITEALEGVNADGFNAVTVWIGGGYHLNDSWDAYSNYDGQRFWAGEPWRSPLGSAWSSVDWVVSESKRLGLTANLSFCGGYENTGARTDWENASDSEMYDVGVAVAQRYSASDNIAWHVMFDSPDTPDTVAGNRIDALFQGINDTEGVTRRAIRWAEPLGQTVRSQFLAGARFQNVNLTLNGIYDYGANSTELVEQAWAEDGAMDYPLGDAEPPYDGSPYYGEGMAQQLRERSYAVFLEGGSYINYGHEDWWPFGVPALFSEGLTWQEVPMHSHTLEQSYVWALIDTYVADPAWIADDGALLTAGEGSGDDKAAAGRSPSAGIVYLPAARSITLDTTPFSAMSSVRLRWYDPTRGTFSTMSASEPPTPDRVIDDFPADHNDGSSDWVLVVDAA